jgi:hypothetical protein
MPGSHAEHGSSQRAVAAKNSAVVIACDVQDKQLLCKVMFGIVNAPHRTRSFMRAMMKSNLTT